MDLLAIIPYDVAARLVPEWDVMGALVPIPALLAIVPLLWAWRFRGLIGDIRGAKASPIGLAKDGNVALNGMAQPAGGTPLEAPLTGEPCVWYRYEIQRLTRKDGANTDSSDSWTTAALMWSHAPILLTDATGTVRVEPQAREVIPAQKRQWRGGTFTPAGRPELPEYRAWNAGLSGKLAELAGALAHSGGDYRYKEEWIPPGVPLFVSGRLKSDPEPGQASYPVPEHRERAVEAGRRIPRVVVVPPGRSIVIAAGSTESVVRRFQRNLMLALGAAALLVLASLYLELTREVFWETAERNYQESLQRNAPPR